MPYHPDGPSARGDLDILRTRLLFRWQELCDQLVEFQSSSRTRALLVADARDAQNALVAQLAGAGRFVLYFPDPVRTHEGNELPAGYYRCALLDAQAGGPHDHNNVSVLQLRLILDQPSGEVRVRLIITHSELAAIYDAA